MGPATSFRVALIGQSAFGAAVFQALQKAGFLVSGVFTIPDSNARADPLAVAAEQESPTIFMDSS